MKVQLSSIHLFFLLFSLIVAEFLQLVSDWKNHVFFNLIKVNLLYCSWLCNINCWVWGVE